MHLAATSLPYHKMQWMGECRWGLDHFQSSSHSVPLPCLMSYLLAFPNIWFSTRLRCRISLCCAHLTELSMRGKKKRVVRASGWEAHFLNKLYRSICQQPRGSACIIHVHLHNLPYPYHWVHHILSVQWRKTPLKWENSANPREPSLLLICVEEFEDSTKIFFLCSSLIKGPIRYRIRFASVF